jgi:20S proteasome alpha/beta subunit
MSETMARIPSATIAWLPLFLLLLCNNNHIAQASQAAGTETLVGIVGKDFILLGADSSVSQSISLTASNIDKIAPLSEPILYDATTTNNNNSPCIVAAAAGDAAASDRLVTLLQAHATMEEYSAGLGCDVEYIHDDGTSLSTTTTPGLDVEAMANLARSQISSALRSQTPYRVCLLIAGMMHESTTTSTSTSTTSDNKSTFLAEKVQRQLQTAWDNDNESNNDTRSNREDTSSSTTTTTTSTAATTGGTTSGTTTSTQSQDTLQPRLYWLDEYGSSQLLQYGAHGHGANFCLSILDQGFAVDMNLDEALALMKSCFQQLRTRYVINSPQPPCIKCVDKNGIRLIRI